MDKATAAIAAGAAAPLQASAEPAVASKPAAPTLLEQVPVPQQQEPSTSTAEAALLEQQAAAEQAVERPVQKNTSRCFCCNKKIGLTGFRCGRREGLDLPFAQITASTGFPSCGAINNTSCGSAGRNCTAYHHAALCGHIMCHAPAGAAATMCFVGRTGCQRRTAAPSTSSRQAGTSLARTCPKSRRPGLPSCNAG